MNATASRFCQLLAFLVIQVLLFTSVVHRSQAADGQDQVLLRYGYYDELTRRISCLEVSVGMIESLPKVFGGKGLAPLSLNLNNLLDKAKNWIESREHRLFRTVDDWLVFDAPAADPRNPFGPDGARLDGLQWDMRNFKLTEIDIGQRRSSPYGTVGRPSGRILIELTLDGKKTSGSVERTVQIFYLQDGTMIEPRIEEATKAEVSRFRSEGTEKKSQQQ